MWKKENQPLQAHFRLQWISDGMRLYWWHQRRKKETKNLTAIGRTNKIPTSVVRASFWHAQWNIALTKSQKNRMKQSAKTYRTTNNPIEELQRGVHLAVYHWEFWSFNPKLLELGMLEASSAFVLLQKIVPRYLLLLVFDKVFSAERAVRKTTSHTSKKKIPTKHEILSLKEADAVFSILNTWLFNHLAKTDKRPRKTTIFTKVCERFEGK